MKNSCNKILFFIFVFFCLTLSAYAEGEYVSFLDAVFIRKGPGTTYESIKLGQVGSTYYLKKNEIIPDESKNGSCDEGWYEIDYNGTTGYVCSGYVKAITEIVNDNKEPSNVCEAEMKIAGFPSTYWAGLCSLKEKYPDWKFNAIETNIEWVLAVEKFTTCGDSLVYNPSNEWLDTTCSASEGEFKPVNQTGVAYYLDHRNFLDEKYIFQFEHSKYNIALKDKYELAVKSIIDGTNFYKYHLDLGTDLAKLLASSGETTNVSPTHLASRMYQELGSGTRLKNLYQGIFNGDIKGTIYDFRGFYNFYNIGVTGYCVTAGMGATHCGLTTAKNNNWNSVEAAVAGGGSFLNSNYINLGQYTSYLERFNVVPTQERYKYVHYYMANLGGPSSEATTVYNAYKKNDVLNSAFEFYIPVYLNMGATIVNSGSGAVEEEIPSAPTPSVTPVNTIVTTAGYKISNDYISGISPNSTVISIKENIESIGGSKSVVITNNEDKEITDKETLIGTGFKISVSNTKETKTYKVVIKGDASGDGKINAQDLIYIQRSILGTYNLKDAYLKAADPSKDDKVNAQDLIYVQRHVLETYTIEQ